MGPAPGGLFGSDWVFVAILVTFLAAALAVHAAFLFTLMRCLSRVDERNRALSPGLVWLGIIPLFNHLWYLIMIPRVTNSLRNEWEARGWRPPSGDFGHNAGMGYAIGSMIISCCSAGSRDNLAMSGIILLVQLGLLVVWIVYWVKLAGYSRQLGSQTPPGEEFADYDDEFRRPRREGDDLGIEEDRPSRRDDGDLDDDRDRRRRDE